MSERHQPYTGLNPGDSVVITHGAFAGMPGAVIKTDDVQGFIEIQVVVLGRPILIHVEPGWVRRPDATDPPRRPPSTR